MEIDITPLASLDQFPLSHSVAEGGQDAGKNTWRGALTRAKKFPLLDTEEKLNAMRDFALSSGGWSQEEIDSWPSRELNALFLQWIAGDCREMPAIEGDRADSLDKIDWEAAEEEQSAGLIPGNLYRGDDGRIYFYLGF